MKDVVQQAFLLLNWFFDDTNNGILSVFICADWQMYGGVSNNRVINSGTLEVGLC